MKVFTLPSDVERGFAILIVNGRLDSDTSGGHDLFEGVSLVDVKVVGHLHVFEHIQVLRGFNILSSDLSELFICDFHVNCVVNIRPLWGRSGFLAELRIPHHKIRCLFEIIESELLFDRSVA